MHVCLCVGMHLCTRLRGRANGAVAMCASGRIFELSAVSMQKFPLAVRFRGLGCPVLLLVSVSVKK